MDYRKVSFSLLLVLTFSMILPMNLFSAIPVVAEIEVNQKNIETRLKNSLDIDHGNGKHTAVLGLPEFIFDSNSGKYINAIVTESPSEITVNSGLDFAVSKVDCSLKVLGADGQVKTKDIVEAFYTDDVSKDSWTRYSVNDQVCQTSIENNSTGVFVFAKKTDSDGFSFETIYKKFSDADSVKADYIFTMGNPDGKTVGIFKTTTNENTDSVKVDQDNYSLKTGNIEKKVTELTKEYSTNFKKQAIDLDSKHIDFGDIIYDETLAGENLKDISIKQVDDKLGTIVRYVDSKPLLKGEQFVIDPVVTDVKSRSFEIETNQATGTDCPSSSYTLFNVSSSSTARALVAKSTSSTFCARGAHMWNLTSVPDNSVVTNVKIQHTIPSFGVPYNCDVNVVNQDFFAMTAANMYADIGSGTSLASNTSFCITTGSDKQLDLGTTGVTELQSALNLGHTRWGVGFKIFNETRISTDIGSKEGNLGTANNANLIVTYRPPNGIVFDVNYFSGTALTTGNVIQTNSSTSRTITINSTGFAGFFTGLTGNQNVTVKETTDDFVVNKTRNYSVTTGEETVTVTSNIYDVNCSQTGSSSDVRIKINQTDGHTITSHTTPTCNSSNVVSWNATFTTDGTSGATFTSSMIAEILNATAYGKNATHFFVNGTDKTTTFSTPKVTSVAYDIGQGITSYLVKFYLWLDPKPEQTNGLQTTGISSSQIDLSWTAPDSGVTSIIGYQILVSTDDSTFSTHVNDTGSALTSYSHTALPVGATRYYKVAAWNSYGLGELSSSISGTASAGSQQQQGSGGGGGGGGSTPSSSNQLTTFSITPKQLTLTGNGITTGEISVTWSSGSDLSITSINYGNTPFDIKFNLPLTLKGSGSSISTGKILYNIVAPKELQLKKYEIPVTITAIFEGSTVTQQSTILINTLGDVSLNLFIIIMLIGFVGIAFGFRHYYKTHHSHHKDGHVLKKLKEIEHDFEKPGKNGSALKELRKFKI